HLQRHSLYLALDGGQLGGLESHEHAREGIHRSRTFAYMSSFGKTRRTPRSTLFPYTTLFRSTWPRSRPRWTPAPPPRAASAAPRSEEHTSELQSLTNLVCRLLLEKKTSPATRTTTRLVRCRDRRKRTAIHAGDLVVDSAAAAE